jgi:hypothetical protein
MDYPYLNDWMNGQLAGRLDRLAAEVAASRPLWLDERQVRPYAAAKLSIVITEEWLALTKAGESKETRTSAVERIWDWAWEQTQHKGRQNWVGDLADMGRTRTIGSDIEAIRAGHPERGQYYWY